MTLLGTGLSAHASGHPVLDLPDDRLDAAFDGADRAVHRPAALHYAPVDHEGVRRRVAAIATWIAATTPALMVIDVSCEVAMLARLASVPTLYVRLGGLRVDEAHRQAFHAATAIMAPFAAALDDPDMPPWVREKTTYIPGLARRPEPGPVEPDLVTVIGGGGGSSAGGADWARAARAMPDRRWCVIGPCTPVSDRPENLHILGWVDDAAAWIARAGIVVGSAGNGVIGMVLAARRPFVCVPEPRPFGEQWSNARGLSAAGAAVVCGDVATADWPTLIAAAGRLDPRASAALDDPHGPARAAAFVATVAKGATA